MNKKNTFHDWRVPILPVEPWWEEEFPLTDPRFVTSSLNETELSHEKKNANFSIDTGFN